MKKLLCLLGLLTYFITSCSDDSLNDSEFVAGDTFTNSKLRVLNIDTMSIETSTIKFDSIITSQTSRLLVGSYNDPIFGTVSSSGYMGMLPSSYGIDSEAVYDSICLYLKYDKYYYNDTLQSNSIHIKRLNEKLKAEDDDYYYNTSEFESFENDLGSLKYFPRPLEADTLEIKLDDSFGKEIFDNLQDKNLTNSDEFKNYFKGIKIDPGEVDNGSIIGFSVASAKIRLYYSIAEEEEWEQYSTDMLLNSVDYPNPVFNHIEHKNPITFLNQITDQEDLLNSQDANNQSFIQSGTGIATRILFPNIKSLYDIEGEGTLLDAVLKLTPVKETYNNQLYLRDSLAVFIIDQNNNFSGELTVSDLGQSYAILNRDNEEFGEIYYELSLGNYLENLLEADQDTEEALVLLPDNYNATVDRFILGGAKNSENQVILDLTYAIYDEN